MAFHLLIVTTGALCGGAKDTLEVHNSKKFDRELSPLLHSIFFETEVILLCL